MGVDAHVLRLLTESVKRGLSFRSTMMIGRQNYYQLKASDLRTALKVTNEDAAELLSQTFIEPLLQRLGANRIESLDNSEYEQATVIHDLNQPIPEHLRRSFSCVFDGGAIEHVFNFPQAIKNCMEMVAIGGHFLGVTTANNFMGHGFYQFSPELYYRVFSAKNGYAVEDMLLCETDRGSAWYRVVDPEVLGRRVELINSRPTYIMVIARRVADTNIFEATPQQSDYVSRWNIDPSVSASRPRSSAWKSFPKALIPEIIKKPLRRLFGGCGGAFQSDAFRRV